MEPLIPIFSELCSIKTIIGNGKIDLPQIVVVGSQSSGKSSVLEGIVGWDFLPRGKGTVTRRPLILNLVNVPEVDPRREQAGLTGDWATFKHLPDETFTDFQKVKQEIINDTLKVVGNDKNISPEPIYLTIFSDKVIDLSLVDLPGAITYCLPNQSNTMKSDIEKIIDEYLRNPKSLILAVTHANRDANSSDALRFADKYDPEGKRTLCVLTNIDNMDRGTNAYDKLNGEIFPVQLGIIGVINRSQEDIDNHQSIEDSFAKEEKFFLDYYPDIAAKNGMPYLRVQLHKILENHIIENLTPLRDEINNMTIEEKKIMASLGNAPEESTSRSAANKTIRNFVECFKNSLNGTQEDIEVTKIVGGASINYAFKNFSSFKDIRAEDGLTDEIVITAMRNSHGTNVPMFIDENCFKLLSIRQIKRLKDPSVAFVDTIKNILLEIVDYCTSKLLEQENNRYPRLYKRINKVACDFVNQRLQPTKEFVEKLVNMQSNYINVRHPEFNMPKRNEFQKVRSNCDLQKSFTPNMNIDVFNSSDYKVEEFLSNDQLPSPPSRGSSLAQTPKQAKEVVKEEKHAEISFDADNAELEDCKIMKDLVIQYYNIICKLLQFELSKAIMMELVNHVKDNIHEELEQNISALGEVVKELTKESEEITKKREETATKLEELERAKQLLQKITEGII
uniref:Dynamin GTPase n=1 Tax=Panagrolaimus sp. ES5 TaxID=591445 RepID=A0AC34GUK2_9BILA